MEISRGFTLVELMIVILIIGVLIAIAIPIYQYYVSKSQVVAAIAELNGAKPQYELIINGASASSSNNFTVANMFFSGTQSNICIYIVNSPDSTGNANGALTCKLQNVSPSLEGQYIYLNRSKQGDWQCSTSSGVSDSYKQPGCI